MEISNSIDERPRQKNGDWISDKTDENIHGYGLKSVRRIVDKYGGNFSCKVKDHAFYADITFFDMEKTL